MLGEALAPKVRKQTYYLAKYSPKNCMNMKLDQEELYPRAPLDPLLVKKGKLWEALFELPFAFKSNWLIVNSTIYNFLWIGLEKPNPNNNPAFSLIW